MKNLSIFRLPFLLFLPFSALAQPELSGTPDELRRFLYPNPSTVNITGSADISAYKDIAKVSLLVTTEERSLQQAMETNADLRQRMFDSFIAAGIAEQDINNSKFSTSPQFGIFGRNPSSFEVSARLEVSVSGEAHLQLLAQVADDNDEVVFEQTSFEHSAEDEFEDLAREEALTDIMEQKAYYESTLDMELKAINFFYAGVEQIARSAPIALTQTANSTAFSRDAVPEPSRTAAAIAPSFDEVKYQTSVTVVFEIVDEE